MSMISETSFSTTNVDDQSQYQCQFPPPPSSYTLLRIQLVSKSKSEKLLQKFCDTNSSIDGSQSQQHHLEFDQFDGCSSWSSPDDYKNDPLPRHTPASATAKERELVSKLRSVLSTARSRRRWVDVACLNPCVPFLFSAFQKRVPKKRREIEYYS